MTGTQESRSPLYAVLEAIEEADGPVSVAQLARELGIEAGAVEGMIDFWARKGRLHLLDDAACNTQCASCRLQGSCPLLSYAPRRYRVTHGEDSPDGEA
ncbi:MAG TPA: hypothetical protein ENI95_14395 [Chloroflexi bacterium]|nr:hypothetical protein [Chloroflexota bacterium]